MNKVDKILNILKQNTDTVIIYNKSDSHFILEKANNNKKIETKEFIKTHKILKKNLNTKIDKEYKKEINHFFNVLTKKLSHCNFDNLNKNIETLFLKKSSNKLRKFNKVVASYYASKNKIEFKDNNYKESINHELLHMSSTKKINKKLIFCGLAIIDFKNMKKYGVFINEGYTAFLDNRYFKSDNSYIIHRRFIILLIKIIGDKLMEKIYFNADLSSLINELTKYNSIEEAINFIINTDIIHKYLYTINPISRKRLKKAIIETNAFLVKSYYEKLKKLNYTENQIICRLQTYMNELSDIELDYFNNDRYMDNINDYFENLIKEKENKQKKLKLN